MRPCSEWPSCEIKWGSQEMAVMVFNRLMAKILIIGQFVLPHPRNQHRIVAIKFFAINLHHHSHFLAISFDFTTFTLAILNRATPSLQPGYF